MTDGLMFVAIGDKAAEQFRYASNSLNEINNHYPVEAIRGDYGAANKHASRHAKTTLFDQAPYDRFVYLDADTRPRESLQPLFDILSDGWDIVLAISSNQDENLFWHVGEAEREKTLEEIAIKPLQLQCGMMAVCKNERTKALFERWHKEWMRYSGEDQAAFIRALYQAPVKIWLVGQPWNGGAAISHNWGALR